MWDNLADGAKIREFETKGSFGMCIDLVMILSATLNYLTYPVQSVDGRFTASGHENGAVYIFNNDTGRLAHSLPGM